MMIEEGFGGVMTNEMQRMIKCGMNVAICLYMLYASHHRDCGVEVWK